MEKERCTGRLKMEMKQNMDLGTRQVFTFSRENEYTCLKFVLACSFNFFFFYWHKILVHFGHFNRFPLLVKCLSGDGGQKWEVPQELLTVQWIQGWRTKMVNYLVYPCFYWQTDRMERTERGKILFCPHSLTHSLSLSLSLSNFSEREKVLFWLKMQIPSTKRHPHSLSLNHANCICIFLYFLVPHKHFMCNSFTPFPLSIWYSGQC